MSSQTRDYLTRMPDEILLNIFRHLLEDTTITVTDQIPDEDTEIEDDKCEPILDGELRIELKGFCWELGAICKKLRSLVLPLLHKAPLVIETVGKNEDVTDVVNAIHPFYRNQIREVRVVGLKTGVKIDLGILGGMQHLQVVATNHRYWSPESAEAVEAHLAPFDGEIFATKALKSEHASLLEKHRYNWLSKALKSADRTFKVTMSGIVYMQAKSKGAFLDGMVMEWKIPYISRHPFSPSFNAAFELVYDWDTEEVVCGEEELAQAGALITEAVELEGKHAAMAASVDWVDEETAKWWQYAIDVQEQIGGKRLIVPGREWAWRTALSYSYC